MSAKNTYRLINPYIEGSIKTVMKASNSFSAAKKMYKTLSEFFTNPVDTMFMVVQNLENNALTTVKVSEIRDNGSNNGIEYKMVKIDDGLPKEVTAKLLTSFDELSKQTGGKHHKYKFDDSSSSSSDFSSLSDSDSDDTYIPPISRYVYYYLPYQQIKAYGITTLDSMRLYTPTFSLPVNPSIEIRLDLIKF